MTSDLRQALQQESFDLPSVRRFLQSQGYLYREPWGKYLERFSKKGSSREFNVLVPQSRDIVDFDRRIFDLVADIAEQLKSQVDVVIRDIINSRFQIVRLVANEGSAENTLSFDAGIDLLKNGMTLIDSSATLAVTGERVAFIRGRRPDVVRHYLDQVRIGQTEIGSFIVTLLMPVGLSDDELGYANGGYDDLGAAVAENFNSALQVAEQIVRRASPMTTAALVNRGLTHNFSQALANMVEAVDSLSIGVAPLASGKSRRVFYQSKFDHEAVPALRDLEYMLGPNPPERRVRLRGVITAIRESSRKASGTVTIEAEVDGDNRSVNVAFGRDDRPVVADCFERKADLYLVVSGTLVDQGGHLKLESASNFGVEPRGLLA